MMKLSFSKKAGLQMSINAIVVLVMAMVVLGLGLGFIRGMFSSAEGKFSGAIDAADLTTTPSLDNPITFEKQTIPIKKGTQGSFIMAFYSENPRDATGNYVEFSATSTKDFIKCSDPGDILRKCFSSPSLPFAEGEAKGFNVLVDLKKTDCSSVDVGKYICSATIDTKSKQFFLQVTN